MPSSSRKGDCIMSKDSPRTLFLDTETTGSWLHGDSFSKVTTAGDPYKWDDLTEVAVCSADGETVYREYVCPPNIYLKNLIRWYPEDKPISAKNTNCSKAMMGKSPAQIVKELVPLLAEARVVVHNLDFDRKVIEDSCEVSTGVQASLEDLFPTTEFLCSKKRALRVLPKAEVHYPNCGKFCKGHRLTHLHHQFGFGDYDEHDPLADVQALAKVWSVLDS